MRPAGWLRRGRAPLKPALSEVDGPPAATRLTLATDVSGGPVDSHLRTVSQSGRKVTHQADAGFRPPTVRTCSRTLRNRLLAPVLVPSPGGSRLGRTGTTIVPSLRYYRGPPGFAVLGQIVQDITGQSLDRYLLDRGYGRSVTGTSHRSRTTPTADVLWHCDDRPCRTTPSPGAAAVQHGYDRPGATQNATALADPVRRTR